MTDGSKGLYISRVVLSDASLTMKMVYAVMIEGMDEYNLCRLSSHEIAERLDVTSATASNTRIQLCNLGYVYRILKTRNNYRLTKIKKKKRNRIMNNETISMTDLISVKSALSLSEQFEKLSEPLETRLAEVLALECTEGTRKAVKEERATLRKTRQEFADALSGVEKQVLRPWVSVRDKATLLLKRMDEADGQLKKKIDSVESGIKQQKEDELRDYFDEKRQALALGEWCTYESANIAVLMSVSMKKLMGQVDFFLDAVSEGIQLLGTMEDAAECIAEYKTNGYSVAGAVQTVRKRHEQIAAAEAEYRKPENPEPVQKPQEPVQEALTAPRVVPLSSEEHELKPAESVYTMSFRVSGTRSQLKALKQFILENNITIIE